MTTPGRTPESDPLLAFCRAVVEASKTWPSTEEVVAERFVSSFGIAAYAGFEALSRLCMELGISVSVRPMPGELRGHNSSFNGRRSVVIAENQSFPGANEHTLLHELRELLERSFVCLGFPTATTPEDLEDRAEKFACLVRSILAREMMVVWLEQSEQVKKKWLRYGAYLLSVLGGLAVFVSCILLPALEDQALEFRRQRSIYKPAMKDPR